MGKANEGMYIYQRSFRSISLMLGLTVLLSCGIVYSRGNRTPESEKKQTSVYLIKRKMNKKILFTYVYIPFCCHVVMADTKRAAAHRRQGSARGVAAYTRTPEREQTIHIGWHSHIGKKFS